MTLGKVFVDDTTNSSCDTCLVKDESIRLDDMNSNSISLNFVDHDYTCQSFHLKDFNASLIQDPNFKNVMSCSHFKFDEYFGFKKNGQFCHTDWVIL